MNVIGCLARNSLLFLQEHAKQSALPYALDYPFFSLIGFVIGKNYPRKALSTKLYAGGIAVSLISPFLGYALGFRGKIISNITRLACAVLFGLVSHSLKIKDPSFQIKSLLTKKFGKDIGSMIFDHKHEMEEYDLFKKELEQLSETVNQLFEKITSRSGPQYSDVDSARKKFKQFGYKFKAYMEKHGEIHRKIQNEEEFDSKNPVLKELATVLNAIKRRSIGTGWWGVGWEGGNGPLTISSNVREDFAATLLGSMYPTT